MTPERIIEEVKKSCARVQEVTELKEFILSSPERRYPITYLDGLTEDHLKLIVHNIEKDRELNALKSNR